MLIAENMAMNYEKFQDEKGTLMVDKEENTIYYENGKVKAASVKLRALSCMMIDCRT